MVTAMDEVEKFVTIGLLPENLPPIFSTQGLWAAYASSGQAYLVTQKMVGEFATYSASKRGNQRRIFGLPHPLFIRDQAIFFLKNWSGIEKLLEKATGSVSKPEFVDDQPRLVKITPHSDLAEIRLKKFSRYRYCLVTDVSRYFPSIYTHSIPWALHGKAQAKVDNSAFSASVWANRLDFLLRQTQSKQTIGIPVGPDTSKVVSEILLSAVENEFYRISKSKSVPLLRHVDDIWIAGETLEECEKHLHNIRQALRTFQLDISEAKTKIVSTKSLLGDSWPYDLVEDLKSALKPWRPKGSIDPVSVMNRLVDRAVSENDDGVIRYALRRLDEAKSWNQSWGVLEHFLAQCAIQFPHSFDYVARVIVWRIRTGKTVDKVLWRSISRSTALQHAAIGNDSEVTWSVWLHKELKYKIPAEISNLIVGNCGPLPNALLAHCLSKKLVSDKKLASKLIATVEGDLCAGPSWPLTLELVHLGLGDPSWAAKIAAAPEAMRMLHDAKASMVVWNALPKVFSSGSDLDHEPEYAIEDYSFDYGDDYESPEWADDNESDWEPPGAPLSRPNLQGLPGFSAATKPPELATHELDAILDELLGATEPDVGNVDAKPAESGDDDLQAETPKPQ